MSEITLYANRGRPSQTERPDTKRGTPTPHTRTIVGLSLGPPADSSTLACVERRQLGDKAAQYQVRRLSRWQEVAYAAIVAELADRLSAWELGVGDQLVVDETIVAAGVLDLFDLLTLPVPVIPVTLTVEDGAVPSRAGRAWHVPRRALNSTVATLLQQRRLELADGMPESATLRDELATFAKEIGPVREHRVGARRQGKRDALASAVALACWYGEHGRGTAAYVY